MNCIIIDDDVLSRNIIERFIKKTDFLTLIASYKSAVQAINTFQYDQEVDLIFLDIEMPEMSGIDFLNSLENPPQVIIISSKEKYALEAFEYNVTDYLLKPVSYSRFFKAADKAFEKYNKNRILIEGEEEIFVKRGNSIERIVINDIVWIEAAENYIVFYMLNEDFLVHLTLKYIENQLPPKNFRRVHRSFIVNINYLKRIDDKGVLLTYRDGLKLIPTGKKYKDAIVPDIRLLNK